MKYNWRKEFAKIMYDNTLVSPISSDYFDREYKELEKFIEKVIKKSRKEIIEEIEKEITKFKGYDFDGSAYYEFLKFLQSLKEK